MNIPAIIANHLSLDMPRSDAYKLGLEAGFRARHERVAYECPYKLGTEACDAYFGGREDGEKLYEKIRSEMGGY